MGDAQILHFENLKKERFKFVKYLIGLTDLYDESQKEPQVALRRQLFRWSNGSYADKNNGKWVKHGESF